MDTSSIKPERIKTPIQLLAVWFVALIILVSTLIRFSLQFEGKPIIQYTLVLAAVSLIPLFIFLVFRMQTKHRPELLSGENYIKYLQEKFQAFNPVVAGNMTEEEEAGPKSHSYEDIEKMRIETYENNRGVFLVHNWIPSKKEG